MEIISRQDAKAQGLKHYYTGKPCKRGHIAERYVSGRECVECRPHIHAAYRIAHPERMRESRKKWALANPGYKRAYAMKRGNADPALHLWRLAKRRAARFGIPFDISPSDIVVPSRCPVLGVEMAFGGDLASSPSLDRIVPALGYTVGNLVVVSHRVNTIKNNATVDELQKVAAFYSKITKQPQTEI